MEMDSHKVPVYPAVCRLCLEIPGVDDIFENLGLVQDIYLCTGVMIKESNNLPRKICKKCLEIVTNAKKLRRLASDNDLYIKVLFDDSHISHKETTMKNNKDDSDISSDDEDRLYIDDKFANIESEDNKITNKRQSSDSSDNGEQETKKLAVRRDLFKSPIKVEMISPTSQKTHIEKTKHELSKNISLKKLEGDTSYTCPSCPKTFISWKKLYFHQRSHNKKVACPMKTCGKKFATKGDVEKHMRTHTGERPYTCDICDRSFSQRGTLRQHKENVHQLETLVVF